jgi:2-methylcitrate dehydratase
MAKEGYSGTEAVIEGKEGFMETFGPSWDQEILTKDLGKSFRILQCSMKAFPTEALTHTHISATLKVIKDNDIAPENIEEIVVTTIARACDILFDPHKYEPSTRETADHSLPYCIARAVLDRKITTQSFQPEKINDPQLKQVIHKIKGKASEEFEKMFPAKQPSHVLVRTHDKKEYSVYLEYPKGDPREAMSEEDLDNKFNSLTQPLLSPEKQKKIKQAIFSCESFSVSQFMELIKA